jgi:pimeloyl-ACP methyl ester carboxylesterase
MATPGRAPRWLFTVAGLLAAGCSEPAPGDAADASPDAAVALDAAIDAPPAPYTAMPGACPDDADAIYRTPADLPPLTAARRGDVVRCAQGPVLAAADAAAAAAAAGATIEATTGVSAVKIAYRTVRGDGAAAVTTATVWLPLAPRATPAPVALIARSTSGIADRCAPSRAGSPLPELGLPFAARGFVAIAPDFAGLGNEGVHAYLDNREAAAQLFDGVRALRALTGGVGEPALALGYSQGGGVVLSAQALEQELTGGLHLRGVVAIAPEWPIRTGSFGYERVLRNPDQLTGTLGLAPPTVTVLRQYGWFANRLGTDHAGDSFPAAERADLVGEIESLCTIPLGAALGAQQPRARDLVDDGFRRAMVACIDGTAGCVEPARGFHAWLEANVLTADAAGAPVLIVQGQGDQVMPAASEAACVAAKLRAEGVTPTICTDTFATHDTILERKIEHAAAWAEAAATGAPRPTCSTSTLPACAP